MKRICWQCIIVARKISNYYSYFGIWMICDRDWNQIVCTYVKYSIFKTPQKSVIAYLHKHRSATAVKVRLRRNLLNIIRVPIFLNLLSILWLWLTFISIEWLLAPASFFYCFKRIFVLNDLNASWIALTIW